MSGHVNVHLQQWITCGCRGEGSHIHVASQRASWHSDVNDHICDLTRPNINTRSRQMNFPGVAGIGEGEGVGDVAGVGQLHRVLHHHTRIAVAFQRGGGRIEAVDGVGIGGQLSAVAHQRVVG